MGDDEKKVFDPCPKCGGELLVDGDGFEFCTHCGYHETDQGSGEQDEETDCAGNSLVDGFDLVNADDPGDERQDPLSVFGVER